MKLIEHLDFVIDLVDRSAPMKDIKGALVSLREQFEAESRTTDEYAALAQAKAAVDSKLLSVQSENAQLKARPIGKMYGGEPPVDMDTY